MVLFSFALFNAVDIYIFMLSWRPDAIPVILFMIVESSVSWSHPVIHTVDRKD